MNIHQINLLRSYMTTPTGKIIRRASLAAVFIGIALWSSINMVFPWNGMDFHLF